MHKKVHLSISTLFLVTILAGCNANNTAYNQNEPEVDNSIEESSAENKIPEETDVIDEPKSVQTEVVEPVEEELKDNEETEEDIQETPSKPIANPSLSYNEAAMIEDINLYVGELYASYEDVEDIIDQQIRVNTESFYIMRNVEISSNGEAKLMKGLIDTYSPDWESIEFEFEMATDTFDGFTQ